MMTFQSTLSVRRATTVNGITYVHYDISIHALRKESDLQGMVPDAGHHEISIHALRKESD